MTPLKGTTVPSVGKAISDGADRPAPVGDTVLEPTGQDGPSRVVGLVDGSQAASTRTFHAVLDETAVACLDELVHAAGGRARVDTGPHKLAPVVRTG